MIDVLARLGVTAQQLEEFCQRHHVLRLSFFGSVLRDDFGPESDVDVLYEFEPDYRIGWDIVLVKEELERLLGRKVDLISFKYINRHLKDRVLDAAREVYVGA